MMRFELSEQDETAMKITPPKSPDRNINSRSPKVKKLRKPKAPLKKTTEEHVKTSRVKVEFRKDLGLLAITMIGIGAMIGSGIFILSGIAAGYAGPACLVAIVLNGIVSIITGMTYAELGSTYPEAGGGYNWVKKGLPSPLGFVSGWTSWFGHTMACGLYALGFGIYLSWILTEYNLNPLPEGAFLTMDKVLAVLVAVVLLYINYRGTAVTGRSEIILTSSKLILLICFIGLGAMAMLNNPSAADNLMGDFFSGGEGGILFAMSLTLIAFQGYEVIAQAGEEVREPKKNIPRAIFISLGVVIMIYILVAIVLFGVITTDMMTTTDTGAPIEYIQNAGPSGELALIEVAKSALGPIGVGLILIGGLLSTLSGLNATIFSSSRVSFAMGRNKTLPASMGELDQTRRTPANAVTVSGGIVIILVLLFPIATIAGAAAVMFLVLFALTNAAVISLRYKTPDLERGFKVPLFPVLPVLGILLNLAMIYPVYLVAPLAVYIGIIWILIGAYVHYFTGGKKEILDTPLSPKEMERVIGSEKKARFRVLVPVAFMEREALADLGAIIAKSNDGDLSLLNIVEVPGATPTSAVGYKDVNEKILKMEKLETHARNLEIPVDARLLISKDVASTILEAAVDEDADLLILGWQGSTSSGVIMGTNIDQLVSKAPCDVLVYKWEVWYDKYKENPERYSSGYFISTLLGMETPAPFNVAFLFGKGLDQEGLPQLAASIIGKRKARVTFNVISAKEEWISTDRERTKNVKEFFKGLGIPVTIEYVTNKNPIQQIVELTRSSDLLLLGTSARIDRGRTLFGDLTDKIAGAVDCPTILLRKASAKGK